MEESCMSKYQKLGLKAFQRVHPQDYEIDNTNKMDWIDGYAKCLEDLDKHFLSE